jgi:hypothetical protein
LEQLNIMYDDPALGAAIVLENLEQREPAYPIIIKIHRLDDGGYEDMCLSKEEARLIYNWLDKALHPVQENE